MTEKTKKYGTGFIFGVLSAVFAVLGIAGSISMGKFTAISDVLLIAGIILFAVSFITEINSLVFLAYFCYLAAFGRFLAEELYTISNVLTAIDGMALGAAFWITAVGILGAIIFGFASTVPGRSGALPLCEQQNF